MSRAFALLSTAYFLANFLFRWAAHPLFAGHGAYGWPKPSPLTLLAIVLGVASSALLVFAVAPWVLAKAGRAARVPQRVVRGSLVIAAIGLVLFAEVDNVWYALSREHLRWSDIQIFFSANPVDHMGISLSQIALIAATLLLHACVLGGGYLAIQRLRRQGRLPWRAGRRLHRVGASALAFLVVGGLASGYALSAGHHDQWNAIARRNLYDVSAARFLSFRHPDAERLDTLLGSGVRRKPAGHAAAAAVPAPARPVNHILLIALEGWNPRFFDAETMPFLSALRREMMVFPKHFSSGNNTLLGMTGLAFGQSPAFFFDQQARNVVAPAAQRLLERGYALRRFGHGLTSYRYIEGYLVEWRAEADADLPVAAESFRRIREHIASNPKTVSLYYYGNSHYPYEHGPKFSKFQPEAALGAALMASNSPEEVLRIVNRYRNALHEADSELRALFESINWRTIAVAITGDHGEAMMEDGRLSHSSSLETSQVGTPLLLYYPGVVPGEFRQTSSHLDIMPTVLTLADAGQVDGLHGTSLLQSRAERRALVMHNNQNSRPTRSAIVGEDHKLIVDLTNLRQPRAVELLDLKDRSLRLDQVPVSAVEASVAFLHEILEGSGCRSAADDPPLALVPPLRHCR